MLLLTRRPGEQIDITLEDGRRIEIMFCGVKGNQTRVGVTAAKTITVDRAEISERKFREQHGEAVNGNVAETRAGDTTATVETVVRRHVGVAR